MPDKRSRTSELEELAQAGDWVTACFETVERRDGIEPLCLPER